MTILSTSLSGQLANFSFFSGEDENLASSHQEHTLKDRIKAVVDRLAYKMHSYLNPPLIMPIELAEGQSKVDRKKFFAQKPDSYEEAKKKHWWLMDESQRKIIKEYANPELRKEKAKEYADRKGLPTIEQGRQNWLVLAFCEEEIHDLYNKNPEYLSSVASSLWLLKGDNKPILDKHKREWEQLSPPEKAEKIFGKRWKYEAAAGVSAAAACFFLCHGLLRYQQLQSPQQPSTL